VKKEFVDIFNDHFNNTNLPNQLKQGARLIGRWMKENDEDTVEIFAIWEYESYEKYREIEMKVRSDQSHVERVKGWYEKHSGREHVYREYIMEVRNEMITSTVTD
jgi:hypothetical protein